MPLPLAVSPWGAAALRRSSGTAGTNEHLASAFEGVTPFELQAITEEGGANPDAVCDGTRPEYQENPGPILPAHEASTFEGLTDLALIEAVRRYSGPHVALSFERAKSILYSRIDNHDGIVRDVYLRREVAVVGKPCPPDRLNAEHTFPRADGVRPKPADYDLHHLFPADDEANRRRSDHPFGEVVRVTWPPPASREPGNGVLGVDAAGRKVFEPPDEHKGNVARAMFYISAVYNLRIPDWQEDILRKWAEADPVDDTERVRNAQISRYQENRNPFIDEPELAGLISDF
jgi:hypothetical protein